MYVKSQPIYKRASATITRPADTTPYDSGDLVANSATAASVTALAFGAIADPGGFGRIVFSRMTKSDDDVVGALFRLHLFTASPVSTAPTNGDNGAIQVAVDEAGYVGSIDFNAVDVDICTGGNTATGVPFNSQTIYFKLPATSSTLYGLCEARATYTPASAEVFTFKIFAETLSA